MSSKIKWIIDVITKKELSINKYIIDQLITNNTHGYTGLNTIFISSKHVLKRIKIVSPFYHETIKKVADFFPRKKVEEIEEEIVIYNNIFKTRHTNSILKDRYPNEIKMTKYGTLQAEKYKQMMKTEYNKRIVSIFDKIIIDEDEIQEYNSLDIISYSGEVKKIDMCKITQKEIYTSIIKRDYNSKHISEVEWLQYFQNDITYSLVWKSFKSNIIMEDTRTCIWELIHLNFFNTYWFNKISDKQDTCPLCKEIPQSKKHIILECNLVKKLWKKIENLLQILIPIEVTEKEMVFGLIGKNVTTEEKMRNWLTFKLREAIVKQERLIYNKEGYINSYVQIQTRANKEISKEIIYHYHIAKKENKLETFFKFYNSKIEIVKLENENLIIDDYRIPHIPIVALHGNETNMQMSKKMALMYGQQ